MTEKQLELLDLADEIEQSDGIALMLTGCSRQIGIRHTTLVIAALRAAPPPAGADAVEQVRRKAQRDADFWRSCLGDEKWNPTHDHIEMAISRLQDIANSLSAIQPAPQTQEKPTGDQT